MMRVSMALAFLTAGLFGGSAWAGGGWTDYAAAFPVFACQDGWMACLVDGNGVSPEMQRDGDGRPRPSDLRVGWDLKPTPNFSPFVTLSAYTGQLVAVAEEPPPEVPPEVPPEAPPEADTGDAVAVVDPDDKKDPPEVKHDPPVVAKNDPPPKGQDPVTPPPKADPPPTTNGGGSKVRPKNGETTVGGGTTAPVAKNDPPAKADPPKSDPGAGITLKADPKPAPVDDSCDNITAMEKQSMLGKLSDGQQACLEGSYKGAAKQTEKDKYSRILMANAYGKGDLKGWEKLVRRHLEEIDQSDADLCYKYALHLAKGGSGKAPGVIRWANVALENRTVWTGSTYQDRVSSLYKIRAVAAQSMWKAAEDDHAKNPTDETKKKVDDTRSQTKVFAREWYEYCKVAGKDTTTALQLCTSAAGTKDYCEGG